MKIEIEKLTKLIDVFENINRSEIENAMEQGDVFEVQGDTEKQNLMRRISYKVLNEDSLSGVVQIDLTRSYENVNHSLIVSGMEYLVASIMLGHTHIEVEAKGEPNLVQALLGLETVEEFSLASKNDDADFSWFVSNVDTNTWANADYVLGKMKNRFDFTQDVKPELEQMSESLWHDKNFMQEAFKFDILKLAPDKQLLTNPIIWEYLTLNPQFFHDIGQKVINIYQKKDKSLDETNFVLKFYQDILSNTAAAIKILNAGHSDFFGEILSDDVKKDEAYLKVVYVRVAQGRKNFSEQRQVNYDKNLPSDYFDDEARLLDYLKNVFEPYSVYEKPLAYKNWINDREKILKYSEIIPDKVLASFFRDVPDGLKKDLDVLKVFIKANSELYTSLPIKFKRNIDLIDYYLDGRYPQVRLIPPNTLFELSIDNPREYEVIKKAVKSQASILMSAPESWVHDIKLLVSVAQQLEHLDLPQSAWDKLMNNRESALALIQQYPKFYPKLSHDIRHEKDENGTYDLAHKVVLKYIKSQVDNEQTIALIPQKFLVQESFCLKLLELEYGEENKLVKFVPEAMWTRPSFIKKVFKKIEDEEISNNSIKSMPVEIKKFFDHYDIKESKYSAFLEKYMLKENLQKNLQPLVEVSLRRKNKI